ncbi:MAG: efflux RND transporter periplasmic adaptor subunit [candidate division WOR-3 bacterium]
MKRISKLLLVTVGLLSMMGCRMANRSRAQGKPVPAVRVALVQRTTVVRTVQLLGTLQGEQQVMVFPKFAGRVTEITRPEGSSVTAGEPIGYLVNDIPGMDYKPGPVLSPITGTVGKIYVEVGQTVNPATPFAAVASFASRLRFKAAVSDADLPFVRRGAKAELFFSSFPDTTFSGTVSQVSPMLDPMSRSATVEITVANPQGRLVPGMAGSARLVAEEKRDVLAIPLAALWTTDDSRVVVVANGTARFQPVTLGLRGDELVEVTSGLTLGEKVATIGKERIKDGEPVTVVEEEPK